MGMMYELGVKFGIQGTDQAERWFSQMKSGISGMTGHISSQVPQAERHLERLALSSEKMSQRFQRAFGLAKAAAGAFIAGKAFSGIAGWMAGSPEADRGKDFLRQYGAGQKELNEYRDHLKDIRKRVPGITGGDYYAGMYDIQSMFGVDKTELNKRGLESALYMAKALDPNATIGKASNIMRTFSGSFGLGKSDDDQLALMEKFSAQIQTTLGATRSRGHDIEISMGSVAALYSQLGRSPADMLSDIGIVGGVLHERSGELLKNIFSKQGEGYGKLLAKMGTQMALQRYGLRSEADLPEDAKKELHKEEKTETERHAAIGARMMANDPEEYWKYLNKALSKLEMLRKKGADAAHILSESFGETAVQGLPLLAKAHESGEYQKLKAQLENADPLKSREDTEKSFQSFSAKYDILKGQVSEASRAVLGSFQGVIADQFAGYGQFFDKIANLWDNSAEGIVQNLRPFVASFKAGFSEAFSGLPNVTGWMTEFVGLLESGKPEKWQEIGKHLGSIAGTNLSEITTAMSSMASALPTIADAIKTIASGINSLKKAGSWYEDSALPWLVDKFTSARGGSGLARPKGETAYTPLSLLEKGAEGLVDGSAYSALENFAGGAKSLVQSIMPSWRQPEAVAQVAPDQPAPEVTVNPSVSVELDGDQIAAKVTQRVEQNLRDDRDRRGGTAGSAFRGGR